MYAHLVTLEQINQNRLSFSQVIDPDVRVNEDSHARSRLRGAASAAESLPPSAASCRPLSIRTRSSTASLIKADRSLTPVSSSARASRSSSSVTVVLMLTSTFRIASRASSFDSIIDGHSRSRTLSPTAKPGHDLTRPGHCLVEEDSGVEAKLAFILHLRRPRRKEGGQSNPQNDVSKPIPITLRLPPRESPEGAAQSQYRIP